MIALLIIAGLAFAWPTFAVTLAALLRVHGRGMRRAGKIFWGAARRTAEAYARTWRNSELSRRPIQQRKEARHGGNKTALAAGTAQ